MPYYGSIGKLFNEPCGQCLKYTIQMYTISPWGAARRRATLRDRGILGRRPKS